MTMSDMQIQQVLAQMRALTQSIGGTETPAATARGVEVGQMFKNTLEEVNSTMQRSQELTTRFVAGDETVSLSEAVVAMQKSSLEFEAVSQVRNRLLAAYQEIMNMPL
jgi:flagellar hook-basal body complex protein FliE